MTANAMQGDRELCLEAGMDDYISKPIRVDELYRALSKCQEELKPFRLNAVATQEASGVQVDSRPDLEDNLQPSTFNPSTAVLDATVFQELREMVDNDAVLVSVIDSYLEEAPMLLKAMRDSLALLNTEALAPGETTALQRAAHTFKSTSATFGATSLSQLCQELETTGCTSTQPVAAAMVSQVETEYEQVKTALLDQRQQLSLK